MSKTAIEWSTDVWNPVVGCTRVSPGCENCYAERFAHRRLQPEHEGLTVMGKHRPRWTGEVRCLPERLAQPLRWRKPRRIFVNSLSDLFHESVPEDFIDLVFAVMALTPWHTYLVLTKRPARMREYLSESDAAPPPCAGSAPESRCINAAARILDGMGRSAPLRAHTHFMDELDGPSFPLRNVHLGVSVEDQPTADERVSLLLQTPAAVRFVSYEPALGPVDFSRWLHIRWQCSYCREFLNGEWMPACPLCGGEGGLCGSHAFNSRRPIDWLIVGGESGPGARPCDVEWIHSTVRQCRAAGIPCFVKQLGAKPYDGAATQPTGRFRTNPVTGRRQFEATVPLIKLRDRKGADPSEWPESLRIRQFPNAEESTEP